jgi:hypothetical protein
MLQPVAKYLEKEKKRKIFKSKHLCLNYYGTNVVRREETWGKRDHY